MLATYIGDQHPFSGRMRLDSRASAERAALAMLVQQGVDVRADAVGSLAFARQLEARIAEVLEVDLIPLYAEQFIPVRTDIWDWAASFVYAMMAMEGQADIVNENSRALPKVGVTAKEWQQQIVTVGDSFDVSVAQEARASKLGIAFDTILARAARRAIDYRREQIAAVGDANTGLVGIANAPGIQAVAQVSGTTPGAKSWSQQVASYLTDYSTSSNPAGSLAVTLASDLMAMKNAISTNTNGLHDGTDALIPLTAVNLLRAIGESPVFGGTVSVISWIETFTGLKIHPWVQLNNAGATIHSTSGRAIVYEKNPEVIQLVHPMPFTMFAPQWSGLAYEVNCIARTGGVMVRKPLAVAYMDGIV